MDAADKDAAKLRLILLVTGFPHPQHPFSGIFNLRAARLLSKHAQVTVVFLRTWLPGRRFISRGEREAIPVITLAIPQAPLVPSELNFRIYIEWGWTYLRELLRNSDLIHSVGIDFAGVVGAAWAARAGIRHITQVIGSDLNVSSMASPVFGGLAPYVYGVACNSQALAEEFRKRYPAIRNVQRVWRGVDLQTFQPQGDKAGPQAQRPAARFLYLGGFPQSRRLPHKTNSKGGLTLLEAWKSNEPELSASGASLLIANLGSGKELVDRWHALLRHPEQVDCTDRLQPGEVPSYLRAADAVLVPSLQEGLPNVAMEASACARAVFGSNVGGIPEVIVPGETGVLLPPGDPGAWGRALVEYARQPAKLRQMGEAGRRRIQTLFDSSAYPERMKELYDLVMREPLASRSAARAGHGSR